MSSLAHLFRDRTRFVATLIVADLLSRRGEGPLARPAAVRPPVGKQGALGEPASAAAKPTPEEPR